MISFFIPSPERVQQLIEIRERLENVRHELAVRHGFAYKRPQYFKNCVVIRWKTSRIKYKINHKKINEYVDFCHKLCDKYDLWEKDDLLLENDLKLTKLGILCQWQSDYQLWAIPNELKEVQEYILKNIPKWAKVSVKP